MDENEKRYDVTVWVPIFAALFAGLLGILGTLWVAGKSDSVAADAFRQYTLRIDDHFSQVEKEISALDARLSKMEGSQEFKRR